jgi:hypothetical protein
MATARRLIAAYMPEDQGRFADAYQEKLQARHLDLCSLKQVIVAPWH